MNSKKIIATQKQKKIKENIALTNTLFFTFLKLNNPQIIKSTTMNAG